MDITDRNRFIADSIMETVYDDIETGARKSIEDYISILEHQPMILEHLNGVFLNYLVNRTGEFKDPDKAGKKAGICARICKDLIESKTVNQQKKDC